MRSHRLAKGARKLLRIGRTSRNGSPVHREHIVNNSPHVLENQTAESPSSSLTGLADLHLLGNEHAGSESSYPLPPPPLRQTETSSTGSGSSLGSFPPPPSPLPGLFGDVSATVASPTPPPLPLPSNLLSSTQKNTQSVSLAGQIPNPRLRQNQGGQGAERGTSNALMEKIRRRGHIERDEQGNLIQSVALLRQNPSKRSSRRAQVAAASHLKHSSLSGGAGEGGITSILFNAIRGKRFGIAGSQTSRETVESFSGSWSD